MEQPIFDQYSLIHFSVGILFFFTRISLLLSTITHATVSLLYNTDSGHEMIRKLAFWWPGSKRPDSPYNIMGDNISFVSGWLVASAVDSIMCCNQDRCRQWYETYNGDHC